MHTVGTDCLGPARAYSGVNTPYDRVEQVNNRVINTRARTIGAAVSRADGFSRLRNRLDEVKRQPSQHAPL